MIKQPEKNSAARKIFMDAFCILYKTKPINEITIQDLAKKAGYNRCTFYQYFKNVDEVLTCLEDTCISHIKEHIAAHLQKGDIGGTVIESFAAMQKETEIAGYTKVLLGKSDNSKFTQRLKAAVLPVFMKRFSIQKNDVKAAYTLEFYLSGLIAMGSRWLKSGREIEAKEIGALIQGLLKKGVLKTLIKSA